MGSNMKLHTEHNLEKCFLNKRKASISPLREHRIQRSSLNFNKQIKDTLHLLFQEQVLPQFFILNCLPFCFTFRTFFAPTHLSSDFYLCRLFFERASFSPSELIHLLSYFVKLDGEQTRTDLKLTSDLSYFHPSKKRHFQ